MKQTIDSRAAAPDRLIEAAIQEIERVGLAQLTVRGVAAAASMNVAAVNYYFRSKEALVASALEGTIRHMVEDTEAFILRMPEDPVKVLTELLGYYFEGARRFPQISKAHLHEAFVADDYTGPFPTLFAPAMKSLRNAIEKAVPGLDETEAARRTVAALSAIFFPAFFAGLYRTLAALDSAEDRATYVRDIARQALAPVRARTKRPRAKRR